MISEKKIKELVLTSLGADAYCLGPHWIYDENELLNNSLDWNSLNPPLVEYHEGKKLGDSTHYGDQVFWLYKFLEDKDKFDEKEYLNYWKEKMSSYKGYIDRASKSTMLNIDNKTTPSGSNSTDLSIAGRVVALLKVSNSNNEFISNVEKFVSLTHNSTKAINTSRFFAELLLLTLSGNNIRESIINLKDNYDPIIQEFVNKGIESKDKDTFETIREFGPACDIDEGFAGVIHLLFKFDNLKEMLIANAKAGGDSSARAMIASVIFTASKSTMQLPENWLLINNRID